MVHADYAPHLTREHSLRPQRDRPCPRDLEQHGVAGGQEHRYEEGVARGRHGERKTWREGDVARGTAFVNIVDYSAGGVAGASSGRVGRRKSKSDAGLVGLSNNRGRSQPFSKQYPNLPIVPSTQHLHPSGMFYAAQKFGH